jgi:arylsulfatase A-like enzyme
VRRSEIDLAPTIADLMGITNPNPPFRGKSLVPEIFGEVEPERPIIADLPRADLMDRRRAIIVGGWKLIAFGDDARWELYNLNKDPWEEEELSKKRPDKLKEIQIKYRALSQTIPNVPVIGGAKLKGAPPGRRW